MYVTRLTHVTHVTHAANWVVVIPPGAAPGIIMLHNEVCRGIYLAIQKNGNVASGRGGKFCHLKVMPQPDNYCCFMSVEYPGQYVVFAPNGAAGNAQSTSTGDNNCQFFIRMEVCGNSWCMNKARQIISGDIVYF